MDIIIITIITIIIYIIIIIFIEKQSSHPSVKKIKKNVRKFNPFSFQKVSNNNAYQLSKNINAIKAVGCDLILPKIAADQLAEQITRIINSAMLPLKVSSQRSFCYTVDKVVNDKHTFLKLQTSKRTEQVFQNY